MRMQPSQSYSPGQTAETEQWKSEQPYLCLCWITEVPPCPVIQFVFTSGLAMAVLRGERVIPGLRYAVLGSRFLVESPQVMIGEV